MLEPIADNLWAAASALDMGPMHFPLRMTVARLPDGQLWLHSPIAIDDALAAALAELGPVGHIVAPCGFHHLYVRPAKERYPDAKVWLSPAVHDKRPTLEHDGILGDDAPDAWADTFDQLLVAGAPKIAEVVFLHRPTRTLIVTDLVFHMYDNPSWWSRLFFRMAGAYEALAQSRLVGLMTRDKAAAARSAQTLLNWEFERIVMAHGDVYEGADAPSRLATGLRRMTAHAHAELP